MKRLFALIMIALTGVAIMMIPPPAPVEAQGGSTLCNDIAVVSLASGTTVVALSGRGINSLAVCGFVLSADTLATTAVIKSGSGTLCGTGTISYTGAMRFVDEGNISFVRDTPLLTLGSTPGGTATPDLCITSATGALTGFLIYGKGN